MITIQYIAGFFDGEGSIFIAWNSRGTLRLGLSFTNTNLEVLNQIKDFFGDGCGYITISSRRPQYKLCYTLTIRRKESLRRVITSMYPYLIVKAEQADIALDFLDTSSISGISMTQEVKNKRIACWERLGDRTCKPRINYNKQNVVPVQNNLKEKEEIN